MTLRGAGHLARQGPLLKRTGSFYAGQHPATGGPTDRPACRRRRRAVSIIIADPHAIDCSEPEW
jgi:hypothetical protein